MTTRVKICGVTRLEDALEAARLGADAIGFNFHPGSRRYLPPRVAAQLVAQLPDSVVAVGVFVDASAAEINAAVAESGVARVQLHGSEPPSIVAEVPRPVIKALAASTDLAARMARYDVDAFLLDAATGGSGKTFDWSLAENVPRERPLYLAGGLAPHNVLEAIRRLRPDFVDVASGVEDAPGIKNHERMARFIAAAREA